MESHAHSRPPRTPLVPPGGVDLHRRDMTATFSADVTLGVAQRHLSALGQWLPIDGDPDLSLGRLVADNSTGPLRLGYGAWRDLLLGVQFLNGRGELITAGGRTVKNVAGYDLTKFMVGQRGRFGRLVTITTRTYRQPAGSVLVRLPPDPLRLNELLPSPLRPQWAALTADALVLGYLGDERTLAFYRERLPTLAPISVVEQTLDEDIGARKALWLSFGERTFRASVPPTKIPEFVRRAGIDRWTADAAFGIVISPAEESPISVQEAAVAVGGSCHVPGEEPTLTAAERSIIDRLTQAFAEPSVPSPGTPGGG